MKTNLERSAKNFHWRTKLYRLRYWNDEKKKILRPKFLVRGETSLNGERQRERERERESGLARDTEVEESLTIC